MVKKEMGLWIDHRKAVIITLNDEVEQEGILEIQSNIGKHVRFSSGRKSHSPDSQGSTAEDVRDREFGDELRRFYEGVISFLKSADAIWIFGPGEAKVELKSQLEHDDLGEKIVGNETVDKMTNPQIAAKVRDYFTRR
jgi:hypothetical protein